MSANQSILDRLKESRAPLAVHEFKIDGYSENNIATRLSELAKEGLVVGNYRKGAHYKEWGLTKVQALEFYEDGAQRCFA